jgi:hypothetical protein
MRVIGAMLFCYALLDQVGFYSLARLRLLMDVRGNVKWRRANARHTVSHRA